MDDKIIDITSEISSKQLLDNRIFLLEKRVEYFLKVDEINRKTMSKMLWNVRWTLLSSLVCVVFFTFHIVGCEIF